FVELKATDQQLDFPVIYASAKNGFALRELHENNEDMTPLFEAIVKHVPPPTISADPFFQMLVSNLDYSDYLGRVALGRIVSGRVKVGDSRTNVSLEVSETETAGAFEVNARGEMQIAILVEQMRREGYELMVSRPEVIFRRDADGNLLEPIENLYVEIPNDNVGDVMQ